MNRLSLLPDALQDAITSIAKLPGIGRKSALRIALHFFHSEEDRQEELLNTLSRLKSSLQQCKQCHSLTEQEYCKICVHPSRNQTTVCIVEQMKDVISIESTMQYNGTYHILNGLIDPLDGIGPDKLNIHSLLDRVSKNEIKEIILALNPTSEGDTTTYYLQKVLSQYDDIIITTIARGVSFGSELEYTDEYTLGKSIENRRPIIFSQK